MNRRIGGTVPLAAVLLLAHLSSAAEDWTERGVLPPDDRPTSAFSADPHRQFDFWIGEWEVNLRMRQADFSWQDRVAARVLIYPVLNGRAILELWDSTPIKGYSLRYYDPATGKWQLWLNWPGKNASTSSSLQGEFRHGRGDFVSRFTDAEGVELIQRYSFNDIYPNSLRWDDHVSRDGGDTWRDNWRMEFTRIAAAPQWPIDSPHAHTYNDGSRCDAADFRAHDPLAGRWTGTLTRGTETRAAELRGYKVLDGCAVMAFLRADGDEWFWFNFLDSRKQRWESQFLSDDRDEPLVRLVADDGGFSFSNPAGDIRHEWDVRGDGLVLSAIGDDESQRFVLKLTRQGVR